MKRGFFAALAVCCAIFAAGCDDHYDFEDQADASMSPIHVDQTFFRDDFGRYLYINGVNLSGSTKVPAVTDPVSYVGKPFPLKEADANFKMLRKLGFNSIRLLLMWEAIEPYEKGEYDLEYLDYIEKVVAKAEEHGIYVLMDMHQDMFSRFLFRMFDDGTDQMGLVDPDEIERAEPYGFNNRVGGDGAPRWVVQTCLPEKNVDGPEWGLPWTEVSSATATSDVLPFTSWFINMGTSVDINRCFAALFAGDAVWPGYYIGEQNVKDYLQEAYAESWRQVAARVGGYRNVIGYDVMNEPGGVFIALTLYALLYEAGKSAPAGDLDEALALSVLDGFIETLMDRGMSLDQAELLRATWVDYDLLPKRLADMRARGFAPDEKSAAPYRPDVNAVLALNTNFNRHYMQPFHERVGKAIQEADPDATIFIEQVLGLPDRGIAGFWAEPMLRPAGLNSVAYAPHFYTDIYPELGFNVPPREFTVDEKRFRDYLPGIEDAVSSVDFSLGKPPVVLGEFGTYYNFGGIEESMKNKYIVSSAVLNPYYEAYEELLLHRMLWCYSPENDPVNGDGWNKEDFSILGPDRKPRAWIAYSRTAPRFTSGRLLSMHFHSPMHYFEPRDGEQTPYLEFAMEMESKETDAPTEIFVPPLQYPDGFYLEISDGRADYDPERFVVYWYPAADDPDTTHALRVHPTYSNWQNPAWDYFFDGDTVREGPGR
ncbi:cellulase family glycosylhydrolase [bacterium]|nr:cellulase family glycosylhydrolase [bacterium]